MSKTREWKPNPGPQTALFKCPADLILYGGAAGGGKTDGALIWATQAYDRPGFRSLLLRRSFPELNRKIIPRSHELFSGVGKYSQDSHTWKFKCADGGEAILEFGYLETEADVERYQGTEYNRIAIDESTRFSERQIRNMFRFLRSTVEDYPRQMLLTTNPIGPGYGFHFLIFIKGREPYKVYTDTRWASDNALLGMSTCFIPAKVGDNPVLTRKDPDYVKRLRTQEGPMAEALLNGRWDVVVDVALDFLYEIHTIDPIPLPEYATRWMAIDWGVKDKACTVWFASDERHVYAYRDYGRPGREIKPYAVEVAEMCRGEKIAFCVLSHECFAHRGTALTQADQFAEVFRDYNIPLLPSDKDAEGRLMIIRDFLRTTPLTTETGRFDYHYWTERFNREGAAAFKEYQRVMSQSLDRDLPKLQIFRPGAGEPGCPYLIQSLPLLVVDPLYPRKLADNQDDHGYDALGYGLKAWLGHPNLPTDLIYQANLQGRIPDSVMGAEMAQREAERMQEELEELKPVTWPIEPFGM